MDESRVGVHSDSASPGRSDHIVLVTDRLTLRPPGLDDASSVLTLLGDPKSVEHNPSDLIRGPAEAEVLLQTWIEHWDRHGFGYWCMQLTGGPTGTIGVCGVKVVTFRAAEALNLLYRLEPKSWGYGYGTEAVSAVASWVRHQVPGSRLIARIRPANVASQRVAIKVGLHHDPSLDEQGEDGLDLIYTS